MGYATDPGLQQDPRPWDGDGEDLPRDVPRLLQALDENAPGTLVFTARARRAEGPLYWAFYQAYKLMHWALTGVWVKVGNFSAIPPERLPQLVVTAELWNHYAAAVIHSKLPMCTIPADRGARLAGRSKMNFTSLVVHGMSAMSVYGDVVGVRLLTVVGAAAALLLVGLMAAFFAPTVLSSPVPLLLGLCLLVLLPIGAVCALFVLSTLQARSGANFLPARDYVHFVEDPARSRS